MRELERVHRTRKKGEGACELGVLMKIRALGLFRRLFEEAQFPSSIKLESCKNES